MGIPTDAGSSDRAVASRGMSHRRTTAAATILALAFAAPPAMARIDPPIQRDVAAPPRAIVQADDGFDWGAAGIGAAATGGLVLAFAGARRGRARLAW